MAELIEIGARHDVQRGRRAADPDYVSALEDQVLILRARVAGLESALAKQRTYDDEMAKLLAEGMAHAEALNRSYPAVANEGEFD
jgi:hypothetical protein